LQITEKKSICEVIHKFSKTYHIETYGIVTDRLAFNTTFAQIVRFVCQHTGISKRLMFSPRRSACYVQARRAIWWLARSHTRLSMPQIGRLSGGYDHTTVLYSVRSYSENSEAGRIVAAFEASQIREKRE